MIVRYWQPFEEIDTLRRQFDRAFGDLVTGNDAVTWTPAIRLVESANHYTLTAQLAGVNPDAIDIHVTRESVAISGDRPAVEVAEAETLLYDNHRYGTFRRVVNLSEAVQNEAVTAEYTNGLLVLTLPKVEEVRNKVVKINLGQLQSDESTVESADTEG
ncbi:MAG: Hsp20/alpha crystallin family protein [Leptolyngbyaceae cyanobacterium]